MLNIVFDQAVDPGIAAPVIRALATLNIPVDQWEYGQAVPLGTHAVVTSAKAAAAAHAATEPCGIPPAVVVAATPGIDAEETRNLLANGVVAIVESDPARPAPAAVAILAAAAGAVAVLPVHHAEALARTLGAPPRQLTQAEQELLAVAATRSIEAAGRAVGLSRRQAQRRYKQLRDDLGLTSHLHAAVAAGRWGLANERP